MDECYSSSVSTTLPCSLRRRVPFSLNPRARSSTHGIFPLVRPAARRSVTQLCASAWLRIGMGKRSPDACIVYAGLSCPGPRTGFSSFVCSFHESSLVHCNSLHPLTTSAVIRVVNWATAGLLETPRKSIHGRSRQANGHTPAGPRTWWQRCCFQRG
jgi:hypothetical protein